VQFEFPGAIDVPDGRYLARGDDGERVLVVETIGAPSLARRRRRRLKTSEPTDDPAPLPLTRVTAVRAQEPFDSVERAGEWLAEAVSSDESIEAAIAEAIGLLNRALHAQAVASVDPLGIELAPERATTTRIGHGSGKEVAAGRFAEAKIVDGRSASGSKRRRRDEELRPQERLAAVLGGREKLDACETLVLRARADLDAGRRREAALQLRVGLEAMLAELDAALTDPGHEEDINQLQARRGEIGNAANAALHGDLPIDDERNVSELLALCERVLRRRRVLRG
jgi:hypothetical protein